MKLKIFCILLLFFISCNKTDNNKLKVEDPRIKYKREAAERLAELMNKYPCTNTQVRQGI